MPWTQRARARRTQARTPEELKIDAAYIHVQRAFRLSGYRKTRSRKSSSIRVPVETAWRNGELTTRSWNVVSQCAPTRRADARTVVRIQRTVLQPTGEQLAMHVRARSLVRSLAWVIAFRCTDREESELSRISIRQAIYAQTVLGFSWRKRKDFDTDCTRTIYFLLRRKSHHDGDLFIV